MGVNIKLKLRRIEMKMEVAEKKRIKRRNGEM